MKRNSIQNGSLIESITDREREIIGLIAQHHTNKEIAETLHLALSTVKWYTRQIFNKLTVNSRREVIEQAAALGLLATGKTTASLPNNIPIPMTAFVERRTEFKQLTLLLTNDDTRLVTLVGAGGNGKTRLAIRAASSLIEAGANRYPDGIWFVSLVSVASAEDIPQTIARTLGHTFFDRELEPLRQLTDYLQPRHLLLILDNFEHLISTEGVRVITEINAQAPHVRLLITSRSRLNIYGEQLFPVPGLQTPGAEIPAEIKWQEYSAIQLFRQCARLVQPAFEIDEENLLSVARVCQLVEGMPLAIELAATWTELLPPEEIAERIEQNLDFLETDQSGIHERQRSIRAVFISSWKRLTGEEQQAYLRLCVVIGSFSDRAAQHISGASLHTLIGLANKSWLQQVEGGRFQLHELMRQFGEEILTADPKIWQDARDSHADYYASFVAEQSFKLRSADQIPGLIAIDEEFDLNIRAAWDWLVDQNRWDEIVQKMALGLYQYVTIVKRFDDLVPLLRDARLKMLASGMEETHRLAFAILGTLEVYCEEVFAILDDNPFGRLKELWQSANEQHLAEAMGFWYVMLAGLVHKKNIDPIAKDKLDEAVAYIRQNYDPWTLGMSLMIQANWLLELNINNTRLLEASRLFDDLGVLYEQSILAGTLAGYSAQNQNISAEIKQNIEKSHLFYKRLGALYPRFNHLNYASSHPDSYFHIGEFENGFAAFHEQQSFFEQTGHRGWLAHSLSWESIFAIEYSTFDHALRTRQRSLELARRLNLQTNISWGIYEYGEIYRVFGDQNKALESYEQANTGFEKLNIILGLGYCQRAYGDMALQISQYSIALTHYWEFLNYASEDNHLWSMAQAHGKLARAYAWLDELEISQAELHTALHQMHTWQKFGLELDTLLAEVVYLIKKNRSEDAAAVAWFIVNHRFSWNQTRRFAGRLFQEASSQLPAGTVERAKTRGEKIVLKDYIEEYLQSNSTKLS